VDVLIRFTHGLGDAVQLTVVLKHLQKYRPDWNVDVVSGIGKHTLFRGLCRQSSADRDRLSRVYDHVFDLGWHENYNAYGDCPSTKVTNCLREVFGVDPDPELMSYSVSVSADALSRAKSYLSSLGVGTTPEGRFRVVLAHNKGNTSPQKKNLSDADLIPTANLCGEYGYRLVVLDWDNRISPDLLTHRNVTVCSHLSARDLWMHGGSGDGETIGALAALSAACVGIDSGPGHVFGAAPTPARIVWVQHHPVNFYDLCPNVVHLLPERHREIPPAHHERVWNYFRDHYEFRTYSHVGVDLATEVAGMLCVEPLKSNPMTRSHMLKSKSFHVEYYDEHRAAGLDYLGHGEWQEQYGKWLVESLRLQGEPVLDVGCACGSIATGMHKAGARVYGVDLNNHMIEQGRRRFPVPLYVCDAVNLHLFGDESFRLVHSNQVGEHWKKDLVPFILREFRRVLQPGGIVFTVLDTTDLFERQNRNAEEEDPTNGCIESLAWWNARFAEAGFVEADASELKSHPLSYFRKYDWDWMLHKLPTS
jgi:SAM-dependent methyltransferase